VLGSFLKRGMLRRGIGGFSPTCLADKIVIVTGVQPTRTGVGNLT